MFPNIDAERSRKGWSRVRLAKELGVSYGTMKNWMSGKTEIPCSKIKVSAQEIVLGVRPSHMVLAKAPGNTLTATVEVSEMMGSEVHFHANAEGKDVVVIVPTMDPSGAHIDTFHPGDKLNLTFSGNVCHIFGQDGKNLEF